MPDSGHLLILGCSQRKRRDPGLLPALDRYDGVYFRVLRKAQREGHWPTNLTVLILSAKYGLISGDEPIADYDQRMTIDRALELRPTVHSRLFALVGVSTWSRVFLNLGAMYMVVFPQMSDLVADESDVLIASGGIGERASQLKHWLRDWDTPGQSSDEPRS